MVIASQDSHARHATHLIEFLFNYIINGWLLILAGALVVKEGI